MSDYKISLDCYGGIIDVDSYKFGLVVDPYDVDNKYCKIINRHTIDTKCNRIANGEEHIKTILNKNCKDKNRCVFNFI